MSQSNIQIWGDGHPNFGATEIPSQTEVQNILTRSLVQDSPYQQSTNQRKTFFFKPQEPEQDPLRKREALARADRVSRKATFLTQRRQEVANSTLNVFYCNYRGINGYWKQQMLAEQVAPGFDLLMLSETKLSKKWVSEGDFTMQTQKRRNGGCLIATGNKQAKAIKGLNTSIAWATIKVARRLIHCVTCYLEPGNSRKKETFLQQLEGIIHSIKARDKEASIIIAGDFNDGRGEVDGLAHKGGLIPVVDPNTPTHSKGGHLDQMYTNLEVIHREVRDIHPKFTDHKGISARLRVKEWKKQAPAENEERKELTCGQIKREAMKESTIQRLLERERIIECETKIAYQDKLVPRQIKERWYQSVFKKRNLPSQEGIIIHPSGGQNKAEWSETIRRLEALYKVGDWKEFFKITKQITRIQKGGRPIKGLQEGDTEILDRGLVDQKLADHFKQIYGEREDVVQMQDELKELGLFTAEDIEEAINSSNFEKGLGPDGFCGKILNTCPTLRERMKIEVAGALNCAEIPQYLRQGRLTALSKVFGKDVVEMDDVRPIVIRSHLSKIMEKALLKKLKANHSHLIKTCSSQSGFKEGEGTQRNIAQMLKILHPGKGRKARRALLFIDLKKAYDSVNRGRLISVLKKRCQGEADAHMVKLIEKLIGDADIIIGKRIIRTARGLPQGSVLAPLLFNVYLEEALKSQPRLWQKYVSGNLLAYADDMAAKVQDEADARTIISDLVRLQEDWGLKINPNKCEILGLGNGKQVEGVRCVSTAKYLGVNLCADLKDQRKAVTNQVTRNLAMIRKRLWIANIEVKECVLNAFVRSVLLYVATPMWVAGLWHQQDIRNLECRFHREIHGIPRDIGNEIMMNVMQQARPINNIIEVKYRHIKAKIERQSKIDHDRQCSRDAEENGRVATQRKREAIYLPKVLAHTMLALARGRTVIYFNSRHRCQLHQCVVDDQHIRECERFKDIPDITKWMARLREQHIREWLQEERDAAIISFGLLKLKLEEMKTAGQLEEVTLKQEHKEVVTGQDSTGKEVPQGSPAEQKRKRGRPRKTENNVVGQLRMEQFFVVK